MDLIGRDAGCLWIGDIISAKLHYGILGAPLVVKCRRTFLHPPRIRFSIYQTTSSESGAFSFCWMLESTVTTSRFCILLSQIRFALHGSSDCVFLPSWPVRGILPSLQTDSDRLVFHPANLHI